MTVTVINTEDLADDIRAAIIQVCFSAFQEEDFLRLFSYIPAGGRHFLAYHGTTLVSHAVVTTRWLQPDDQPLLKTAYVDAVATLPAYQGQGYGSAVMQQLAQNIGDYDIAGLQTDRPGFYARLGWELWRGALGGRSAQGVIPTPEQQGVMVLRLARTPAINLDSALTVECTGRIW
jgi:aminoglycoside 2'-N-acetyltransferase I